MTNVIVCEREKERGEAFTNNPPSPNIFAALVALCCMVSTSRPLPSAINLSKTAISTSLTVDAPPSIYWDHSSKGNSDKKVCEYEHAHYWWKFC